jgi:hypothetical protein
MLQTAPYAVTSGAQTMQSHSIGAITVRRYRFELIATTDPAMIGIIAGMVPSLGE